MIGTAVTGGDTLFQQYTIKEIQDIEKKLRNDIEKKKEDLRQMVGERYRDLIDAADTITEMKTSAENVTKHIKLIEKNCSQLQATTRPSGILSSSTCREEEQHNEKVKMFAVAAQLKVLMDMPTMLWTAVEANSFLSAAQLFLLAQHIHTSLLLNSSQHFHGVPLMTKFPVIRHQSSVIGQFRMFISQKCRESLRQDQLTNKELTDILCCILLLDDSNLTELFKELLDIRLEVIDHLLKLNKEGTTAKFQVCEVVQMIINTIQLVSSVFGKNSDEQYKDESECTLFQFLNSILDKSHAGPVSYLSDKISLSFSYLPPHIKDFRPTMKSNLEPISRNQLQEYMRHWTKKVKNIIHLNLSRLLQYIPSIKGLSLIIEAVELKLAQVEGELWQKDCVLIFNEDLSIYDFFLKDPFTERVKMICNKHLDNAFHNCQLKTSECLQKVLERHPDVQDEDVTQYVWTESQNDLNMQEMWSPSVQPSQMGIGILGMKASRHTPQIQSLCKGFDESLQVLLDDLKCFGSAEQCTRSFETEILQLQKHLATSTQEKFSSLLAFIKDILLKEEYKIDMYIRLWPPYIGRICHAFSELCEYARLCLLVDESHSKEIRSIIKAKNDSLWQQVKTNILQLGDDAFRIWCDYLGKCFTQELNISLGENSPADFLQNVLEWEEAEIQEETEDGKVIKSIIRVPIQASSFLQSSLFSMSRDFNSLTGHVMNKSVTRELDKKIFVSILNSYDEASKNLQEKTSLSPRLIQAMALQLLFDVRLMNDLLCPKDDYDLQRKSDLVTSALEALIDPFDLDVFNPSLQLNLNCALQRSALLFGLIVSERAISVSSQRLGSQNQPSNLLPLSATASRFLLLPITSQKHDSIMSTSVKEESTKSGKNVMSRSFGSSPNLGQTGNAGVTKSYSFYDRVTAMGSSWFGTGN